MTRQRIQLAIVAGRGLACFAGTSQAATFVKFPTQARIYGTWIVRAMDKCNVATVSVVNAGDPKGVCIQANSTTDGDTGTGTTMKFARLIVKRADSTLHGEGLVTLFGAGLNPGGRVKVRLTLRVTKANRATKNPSPGVNNVTFMDTTIDCGNQTAGCFSVRPNGVVAGKQSVAECLTQNGQAKGLAQENIQVVDASLVNCDTGKVFGVPGIID